MSEFNIDITPHAHIIASLQNTNITYLEAISELVDNSLDANAGKISIEIARDSISIIDDGDGCADLDAILALGKHKRRETTKLGRYGVGAKNAIIGLGRLTHVMSVAGGFARSVDADWSMLHNWSLKGNVESSSKRPGTLIRISQLLKSRPRANELAAELGFRFSPAIASGKEILLSSCGSSVDFIPWQFPEIENEITATREEDGRSFTCRAGILANSATHDRDQFIIAYKHRVILETIEPCKDLTASPRFICWVELSGNWNLLKHKDGLSGNAEWLYDELHEICYDLLTRTHKEGRELIKMEGLVTQSARETFINLMSEWCSHIATNQLSEAA